MQLSEGLIVAEHYKLLKQLGQGSFGDVWLAHNLLADIDVAIKFYGTFDQKGLEEFRNEFKIAYKLHHPNLLNINHFDVYENCPYLVMPYCENGSVSRQIGQMPESEIWKFILDVSGGLAFLHSQQPPVVHQDIKPDNILITSDGRYVISDFGISRSFRTMMSRTNNNVSSSGTIAYMGPERFSEKPMVVLASDIWAFGMTLYEVMNGDVLWEGMGGCVQLNGARIPAISGKFSPELTRLVTSCLAAETWNRPTAAQIHEYAAAFIKKQTLPPLTVVQEPSKPTPVEPEPVAAPRPVITPQPSPTPYRASNYSHHSDARPSVPQQSSLSLKSPTVKRGLLIAAGIIAAILLITGGVKLFATFSEEDDFYSCRTKQDYERFIKEHPSSSFVETARQRIATLTPSSDAPTEAPSQQQPSPNNQQTTNTHHPSPNTPLEHRSLATEGTQETPSPNTQTPSDIIDFEESDNKTQPASKQTKTPAANQQTDDDRAFYRCVSKEDYHAYLTNYPNGKHRQAAEARLTDLLNATNANQLNLNKTTPERQDINNTNPNPRTPMSQPGMYRRGGPGPGAGRGPGSGPSRTPGQGPSRGPNRGTGSRHFR